MPVSKLLSRWFDHGLLIIAAIFDEARKLQPSVVFVDDYSQMTVGTMDTDVTLAIKNEFKSRVSRVKDSEQVLIILAVDSLCGIDNIVVGKEVNIHLPNQHTRFLILNQLLTGIDHAVEPDQLRLISSSTCGFSEANLEEVCRRAAIGSILNSFTHEELVSSSQGKITYEDLQEAVIELKHVDGINSNRAIVQM